LADYESLASASETPTVPGYTNLKQRKFCDTQQSKTSHKIEQLPVDDDAAKRDRRAKRPRRRPDRQLQRLRQREKRSSDEARRIQTMFRIYPKRAVRRALGETSPGFSGSSESARNYLSDTYERQCPSQSERAAARAHFDACHWSPPDDDISRQLNGPPVSDEIAAKLARASNTAPGDDRVEYRHLRALADPRGFVLEAMYAAVWRIGIPPCWKRSKTVPIFKKGSTDDYANFRPISLLPTAYKIFSGIVNDRMCDAAMTLGWFSHEQKGFLPGVNGVAEHTQLLQMRGWISGMRLARSRTRSYRNSSNRCQSRTNSEESLLTSTRTTSCYLQ
jgi:hypothetical protein